MDAEITQIIEREYPEDVLPVAFRYAESGDMGFIYSFWSSYFSSHSKKGVQRSDVRNTIKMLHDRHARFVVAYDPDDPAYMYGFACAENPILHFVYVIKPYRYQGIARQLIAHCGLGAENTILCSHWTRDGAAIAKKHKCIQRFL